MIPREFRLRNKKDFSELSRYGKSVSDGILVMKYQVGPSMETKIGISVGLRFSKKATERNKVRRWIREAARECLPRIKPRHKIMFIVGSSATFGRINYGLILNKVAFLLKKAKLIT